MSTRTEAERRFLGAAILDQSVLLETHLTEDMFTEYRGFFAKLVEVSAVTFVNEDNTLALIRAGLDAKIVGELTNETASSANWEYYQNVIFESWATDTVRHVARVVGTQNYPECLDTIEQAVTAVAIRQTGSRTKRIGDIVGPAMERIVERAKNRGKIPGISFWLSTVDEATLGAQASQMIVIGARPSQGKSALMAQIARKMAIGGVKVGIVSVESSETELVGRMISADARVDGRRLQTGMITPADMQSIRQTAETMMDLRDKILIHDQPSIRLATLQSVFRKMVRDGAQCLFLDYLQLVRVPKKLNRTEEVSEVSTAIKALARELKVPIVALAQLNRDADNVRPHMGNFQHSSQIEQDADQGWLLWHKMDSDGRVTESRIIIAKARDGHVRDVKVNFDRPILTFSEIDDQTENR